MGDTRQGRRVKGFVGSSMEFLRWSPRVLLVTAPVAVGGGVTGAAIALSPSRADVLPLDALLGVTTFLVGVLLAFTIDSTRDRLALVREHLKSTDANIEAIASISRVLGDDTHQRVVARIDDYLIDTLDHRLVDFHLSSRSYDELAHEVLSLEVRGDQQHILFDHLVAAIVGLGEARKHVEAVVRQRLTSAEWAGLVLLTSTLLVLLSISGSSSVLATLLVGLLAAAVAVLMVVLRLMDRLQWGEAQWVWEPMHRMFRRLDLVPYVPSQVIETGRFQPRGQVRVAYYDYPDIASKDVRTVAFGADDAD